ncbi:MAG: 4Fe-4S dicluster domain-containing protein [bacterium]|nr:4Fe-4S dicluster domain-containing protein [bacterium]
MCASLMQLSSNSAQEIRVVINIEVNGAKLKAKPGETVLESLKRNGVSVPTLCHMPGLAPSGACRLCVVEIKGQTALTPSCAYPVAEGMVIQTHSPRAMRARKTIIELLLADHPDDCLYCVRNSNCQLQTLAENYGVRERRFAGERSQHFPDTSSAAILRDPAKCILCGRCVRVCEEGQAVAAIDFAGRGRHTTVSTAFDEGLNVSGCINCGQCILVCPTGALTERSHLKEVAAALNDPDRVVVVQHAPSVSVTLAEEFGLPAGRDVCGMMTTAFRRLGFDRVFDTAFTADLTIMEEAAELVHRVTTGGALPMMTSCSPGWVKFVETFYPEFIENVSSCKSPQQMMGAIIKSYFAQCAGLDPSKIYSVAVMPCTAKKFEAQRAELGDDGMADVDAVLTTREVARLIRLRGLDLSAMSPSSADMPFGKRSSAGKIFGATGGVMEAALRTAYHMLTGEDLETLSVTTVRGLDGVKTAGFEIAGTQVNVAVANGLANARALLEDIRTGRRKDIHFIEVMTCPGGCIAGGGQPLNTDTTAIKARMRALYKIDGEADVRTSHGNQAVQSLYEEFLGKPLGEKSHKLLHTSYASREVLK